jgi:hypothetical protein
VQIFPDRNLAIIRQGHKRVMARTTTAVAEVSQETGEAAVAYAKSRPRFTPRTGDLQRANEYRVVRTPGGRIVKVLNRKSYAAAIDKGARPHDIKASKSPFLHFLGNRGWVRTKRVKHPGNKPYRFLYGATLAAGRAMGPKLGARMQRIAKQF